MIDLETRPDQDQDEEVTPDDWKRCTRTARHRIPGVSLVLGLMWKVPQCKRRATWRGKFSRCGHPASVCGRHLRNPIPWTCGRCGVEGQAIIAARRIA